MLPQLSPKPCGHLLTVIALGGFALSALITLAALLIGYIGQANLIEGDQTLADDHFQDIVNGRAPAGEERRTAASWIVAMILGTASLLFLLLGLTSAVLLVAS